MKKILIFKTDRLGDLLNISPVISNIKFNYPSSEITLVCSNYNKSIAEYYKNDLNYIVYEKPLFIFLIKNLKFIFLKKFDLILQLDGKNHSYLLSLLIRSSKKACLNFLKIKKIFSISINISRPNFFINKFFDYKEISYEDYSISSNKNYHYLSLYFKLLEKLNIQITSKNHYLPFKDAIKVSKFSRDYFLIHIDKRWESFSENVIVSLKDKVHLLSNTKKIVITTNVGGNSVFNYLKKSTTNKLNIEFIKDSSIHDIISLIYYSNTCVSSHTGLIVHTGAAFKKKIIDIVSTDIFNELDRWIPFNINYKKINIQNLNNEDLNI